MRQEILKLGSRLALRDMVRSATDVCGFDLEEALRKADLIDDSIQLKHQRAAKEAFDMIWQEVDWSDRTSILPLVPIFEATYATIRRERGSGSLQAFIDALLAQDGFRMKADRLIRIQRTM